MPKFHFEKSFTAHSKNLTCPSELPQIPHLHPTSHTTDLYPTSSIIHNSISPLLLERPLKVEGTTTKQRP